MEKQVQEKKDKLINIRINEKDYHLFKCLSASVGSNPSELLRSYIVTTLAPLKIKLKNGEIKLEDLESLIEDEND